jgi:hypothetical protein
VTLAIALALVRLSLGQDVLVQEGPPSVELRGGADVGAALVSGTWLATVHPTLAFDVRPDFSIELGAPVRFTSLRPIQLRPEDWAEFSDLGQALQLLSIGGADRPVQVRAGELRGVKLGLGHLVDGYFNRLTEDYHPAGAQLSVFAGPVAVELLASDVLAPRLFGAAVRSEVLDERVHAELSAVHDFGLAGGVAPELSLAQLDLDVALARGPEVWVNAYAGGGARVMVADPTGGGELGLSLDARAGPLSVGGRLEARRVEGGYRPGMVGVGYEVARFAGEGFRGRPLADERLPAGFAGLLEGQVAYALLGTRVLGQVSVEGSLSGRFDGSAWLTADLLGGWVSASAVLDLVDVTGPSRVLVGGQMRVRVLPSLYLAAQAGTSFRPAPGGGLERSVTAGLSAGADFDVGWR